MKLNLIGIDKIDNAVLKFSNHIKTCVKLNTLMNLFFIGAFIMILILWLSPELKAISKIYVTKEDEFKDKRDLFEKEDFLYLLNQEFSHSTEQ